MRLILIMFIVTLILSYPLGLVDVGVWAKMGINIAKFVPELGVRWDLVGDALIASYETLIISLLGVSGGTLIAYILAPLASPLIVPSRVALVGRMTANAIRTVPAILWAILFVILVGPGPRAGALALIIYTSGYLAKFFYESLEAIGREHYDSLRVIGLRGLPLAFALYSHAKRYIISNVLFMLEYNVRTATILGFVGAGGIGYYIMNYLSMLNYQATITFVIFTLLLVIAIDLVSYVARLRV
ncbi:MAG TPA: ABC transporter permease subunit [Sulfolobales archaeon]|nr:ABC transporter permease subunit [Sulfolobales archaeon]